MADLTRDQMIALLTLYGFEPRRGRKSHGRSRKTIKLRNWEQKVSFDADSGRFSRMVVTATTQNWGTRTEWLQVPDVIISTCAIEIESGRLDEALNKDVWRPL